MQIKRVFFYILCFHHSFLMQYCKVCIKQGVGNIANDSQSVGKMRFLDIILQLFYLLRMQTRIPRKTMYDFVTENNAGNSESFYTSSRKTRKVTLLARVAVSFPSLVTKWRPRGARLGHSCLRAVYCSITPPVQLLDTTFLYLHTRRHITHIQKTHVY